MSVPTDAASADPVATLLDAQIGCARDLQDILDAETRALLAADLDQLTELVQRKQAAAERLEGLSRQLAGATGGQPDQAIASLGGNASARWQTLRDTAEVLRKVNLHNGALLDERQARLRWIARQAGLDETASSYGPAGRAALYGRSLAQA